MSSQASGASTTVRVSARPRLATAGMLATEGHASRMRASPSCGGMTPVITCTTDSGMVGDFLGIAVVVRGDYMTWSLGCDAQQHLPLAARCLRLRQRPLII